MTATCCHAVPKIASRSSAWNRGSVYHADGMVSARASGRTRKSTALSGGKEPFFATTGRGGGRFGERPARARAPAEQLLRPAGAEKHHQIKWLDATHLIVLFDVTKHFII